MKHVTVFFAITALTLVAFFPATARADDELEDLDVTMEVLDDLGDFDNRMSRMRGPDMAGVGEDDWEDAEVEEFDDIVDEDDSAEDEDDDFGDDEMDDEMDDEFEGEDDFEDDFEDDDVEEHDDLDDGDDVDDDSFDDDDEDDLEEDDDEGDGDVS